MKCKFCGSPLVSSEHPPTDETGTYTFACGSTLDDNGWMDICQDDEEKR